jgi:hypothetical protein
MVVPAAAVKVTIWFAGYVPAGGDAIGRAKTPTLVAGALMVTFTEADVVGRPATSTAIAVSAYEPSRAPTKSLDKVRPSPTPEESFLHRN